MFPGTRSSPALDAWGHGYRLALTRARGEREDGSEVEELSTLRHDLGEGYEDREPEDPFADAARHGGPA